VQFRVTSWIVLFISSKGNGRSGLKLTDYSEPGAEATRLQFSLVATQSLPLPVLLQAKPQAVAE